MAPERLARLEAVVDHGRDTRTLTFRLEAPLAFSPGQFLSCLIPHGGEDLIRPYSVASDPERDAAVDLLLNLVPGGPGSTHLFGLSPGAPLRFTGPWGGFTLERAPDVDAVFIAIGTGIAPIRPMLRRAARTARHRLDLVYATDNPIHGDELAALPGVTVDTIAPDDVVAHVRARFVAGDADRTRQFFVCGVGDVVRTLRDELRGAGYARRAVQYERW